MILYGTTLAKEIRQKIHKEIQALKVAPSLGVILVGNNLASQTYIKVKKRACESIGIKFCLYHFPEEENQSIILKKIDDLNKDKNTHGILVQMPLPKHIDTIKIIESINPQKDVDGFHPFNMGKLLIGLSSIVPCTPLGIKTLLEKNNIIVEGKHVVIVGRSNIVGKPLFALFAQKAKGANATVTLVHSYSKDLKKITQTADILVAAMGKPKFITKDMIKPNAVVIDVGINHIDNQIVGDVDFDSVAPIASYITPVPKGIGPMTVAMLLQNTFHCFKNNL